MSSYTINKTDGSILTDNIADGTVDTTATDLTLIGKNAVNYGEAFNENFVHLLENFANSSSPPNALVGQLWYDTSDNRLKVYTGTGFKVTGGPILSATTPSNAIAGDIWIDTVDQQLRFYVDDATYVLAGPAYTASQGVSGIQVITVFDTAEKEHTLGLLYIANLLIGIFSKDAFTPSPAINGFTGDIVKGFNLGNASGLSFNVPVTSASQLVDNEDNAYIPDDFVKTIGSSLIGLDAGNEATLTIQSDAPLILGSSENTEIISAADEFQIKGVGQNQSLTFIVDTVTGYQGIKILNTGYKLVGVTASSGDGVYLELTLEAGQLAPPYQVGELVTVWKYLNPGREIVGEDLEVYAVTTTSVTVLYSDVGGWDGYVTATANPRIGILTDEPQVALDVNGRGLFRSDLTVIGDLTILGNTTSVTTVETLIKDNVITLNSGETGSGVTANYSGIEVDRGSSNNANWRFREETISWTSNYYVDLVPSTGLLNLNYRIEGEVVLSADTLGNGVTNSSLTSVGTLVELQVDNININGNVIKSNTGEIGLFNNRLSSLATTAYTDSSPPQLVDGAKINDAVNNQTMQNYTAGLPLQFALELTNVSGGDLDDTDALTLLTDAFPVDNHAIGTKLYVQCTKTTMDFDGITVTPLVARTLRVYRLISGTPNLWYWDNSFDISYAF
jgi:hypothetical protein